MQGTPIHIKSFEKGELTKIRIETLWGDISCIGTDANEIKVEVFALKRSLASMFEWVPMTKEEFDAEQFRIRRDGDTLSIKSLLQNDNRITNLARFKKVSFRVFLPKKFSSEVSTYLGNITLDNLKGTNLINTRFGRIALRNLNGRSIGTGRSFGYPIHVDNCHGEMKLSTSGGSIEVNNSGGDQEYISGGGPIRVTDFTGKITVKTNGGSIKADRIKGELKATSLGGSIRINGLSGNAAANTKGGSLRADVNHIAEYLWLETSGGSVRLTFPENQGMDLTAKGDSVKGYGFFNFNGTKKNRRWVGQINQGGANVKLRTAGGSVKLYSKPIVQNKEPYTPPIQEPQRENNFSTSKEKTQTIQDDVKGIVEEIEVGVSQVAKRVRKGNFGKPKMKPRIPRPQKERKDFFDKFGSMPSLGQSLLALLVIIFLVYGLNTVIYFTLEILNSQIAASMESMAILYFNLLNGLITFCSVWLFITFVDKYIRLNWLKYLTLIFCTYALYLTTHGIMRNLVVNMEEVTGFWNYYRFMVVGDENVRGKFTIFQALFFTTIPSLAACAYFTYWLRGRNLTQKISEQEYELLNMEKLKTKAQLTALEARINPHFLYNSLNSIAGLIHEDQDKAEDMTIELSKLFRATTGRSNKSYHTIEDEINLVRSYLEIEQMRFSDRLKYTLNVDKDLEKIMIPRFLLQPLVENAIKHGISKITENGVIEVNISKHENQIHLDIHDNGPDFSEAVSGGYGLKSVRDKLQLIYGEKAHLEIKNTPKKVIHISVDIDHKL